GRRECEWAPWDWRPRRRSCGRLRELAWKESRPVRSCRRDNRRLRPWPGLQGSGIVLGLFDGLAPKIGTRAAARAELLQIVLQLGESVLSSGREVALELFAERGLALAALLGEGLELGLHRRAAAGRQLLDPSEVPYFEPGGVGIGHLAQDPETHQLA